LSSIAYNKVIGLTETDFMFEKKTVVIYAEKNGREPFSEWLTPLKDRTFRARIRNRISRLELGHFGDCEPVGEGIFELRFFFGPGFRVYFAKHEDTTILLLGGGDKKTQAKDILKAKNCWKKFKETENEKI
jgi:putative addiction module killer protein